MSRVAWLLLFATIRRHAQRHGFTSAVCHAPRYLAALHRAHLIVKAAS